MHSVLDETCRWHYIYTSNNIHVWSIHIYYTCTSSTSPWPVSALWNFASIFFPFHQPGGPGATRRRIENLADYAPQLRSLDLSSSFGPKRWVFPKIGEKNPNGWFIRENPINIDDLGVPLFLETPRFCGLSSQGGGPLSFAPRDKTDENKEKLSWHENSPPFF